MIKNFHWQFMPFLMFEILLKVNMPQYTLHLSILVSNQIFFLTPILIQNCPRKSTKICRFAANLQVASLSYIQDHAVKNRRLFPATGFFEACTASSRMLISDEVTSHLSVASISLISPLLLPPSHR